MRNCPKRNLKKLPDAQTLIQTGNDAGLSHLKMKNVTAPFCARKAHKKD